MEFINDTFSQIIYLNDFVYIWKIYENEIIELFNKNNYKKIISNLDICLYDKYGFSKIKNIKVDSEEFKNNFREKTRIFKIMEEIWKTK